MKEKVKFNWKAGAIALVVLSLIMVAITLYIKGQDDFRVVHNPETKSTIGPDGRMAVGAPETYSIMASGELLWQLTKENNKFFRVAAWVMLFLTAGYIMIGASDLLLFKGSLGPVFVMLAIALACWLAAYSSALAAEQTVKVDPVTYETIKNDKAELTKLFTSKPYIR